MHLIYKFEMHIEINHTPPPKKGKEILGKSAQQQKWGNASRVVAQT